MWVTFLQCRPSGVLADVDPEPRRPRDLHRGIVVEISEDPFSLSVTKCGFFRLLSEGEVLEASYFASGHSASRTSVYLVAWIICDSVLA